MGVREELFKVRDGIWGAVGYVPNELQREIHNHPARVKLVIGGERAGKSYSASKELLWWVMYHQAVHYIDDGRGNMVWDGERGLWWVVGPTYELARPEVGYVLDDLMKLGVIGKGDVSYPMRGPVVIRLPFGRIETKSADDCARLAGFAPDGILGCESAQLEEEVWMRFYGRVAERRGKVWASGTLERGQQWYVDLWELFRSGAVEDCAGFSLPTWSNRAIFPGGEEDEEIVRLRKLFPEDLFYERFGAVPRKPSNLVLPEFDASLHVIKMELGEKFEQEYEGGKLRRVVFPRDVEMQVWIDPGVQNAYAVLFVVLMGGVVYVFDEVYERGKTARQVLEIARRRPWWGNVRMGVMDVAGSYRHGEGMTHYDVWTVEGGIPITMRPVGVLDGIDRHRSFLLTLDGEVRLYHNASCVNTIREYNLYRYREVPHGYRVREMPVDANNDAMKAIAYGLVNNFGLVDSGGERVIWRSPFARWSGLDEALARERRSRIPEELR